MTASDYADRANLYFLWSHHPQWTIKRLAQALERSEGWVKRWLKRFREEITPQTYIDGALDEVFRGHSSAPKHPALKVPQKVVDAILDIRDHPPENLRRVPGPKTILYFLPRHPSLQGTDLPLPRSTSTIYHILKAHGRIETKTPREHEPVERPAPLSHWQIDFKDVSTVPADPEGKKCM